MAKVKNSYFSLGFNDLQYLLRYDENDEDSYNRFAVEAQQVVEKILKGIVEKCEEIPYDKKADLLGTHNLRKLGTEVNNRYSVGLNVSDLAYLKDFYFEARYPGENFVEVLLEDRNMCLRIVMEVLDKVLHLCEDVPDSLRKSQNSM